MKRVTAASVIVCLVGAASARAAGPLDAIRPSCRSASPRLLSPSGGKPIHFAGRGRTNILDSGTTLGSAEIDARGRRLRCGILGELQGTNADGSLSFQHTLTCDDHSHFVLRTHTVIRSQTECTTRSGVTGTFDETSTIEGVDGPFAGWSGEDAITGTIDCGFVDFVFSGVLTPYHPGPGRAVNGRSGVR